MPMPFFRENRNNKLICLLLAGIFFACLPHGIKAITQQTKENVQLRLPADSLINLGEFSILVPSTISDSGTLALILFFDPQGKGDVPLSLYGRLAKERSIVIAGSNRCKNDLEGDSGVVLGLDFCSRVITYFPRHKIRVYLAGFSGGAVLASYLSKMIPGIGGLLYAAAPKIEPPSCPAIGITGMADPNFYEMEALQERIPQTVPHCLRYWNGKHAWPPAECMAFAFDWIRVSELSGSTALEMVKKIRRKCSTKMTAAQKEEILNTRCFLSSSLKLAGDDSLSLADFRKSPEYRKYQENKIKERKAEMEKKEFYHNAVREKDIYWWRQEARSLHKAGPENYKAQRMLGYLSLLGYSFSTRSLMHGRPMQTQKCIEIYKLVDPENPEAWYLEAVYEARSGNPLSPKRPLLKAIELGFKDKQRLQNQPEFKELDFGRLLPD